ncbi:MAG: VanW family protein [Armatimonadetes bacterium]|nr:VanW family protein [Armatimonadota bacterium]CUU34002.1 VanW like protein [Armatimonadetes bacterium DC]
MFLKAPANDSPCESSNTSVKAVQGRPGGSGHGVSGLGSVALLVGVGLTLCLSGCAGSKDSKRWRPIANFTTSLEGRTPAQRHNALLAARRIDGQTLAPNATWSFNGCVGKWVRSEGFQRAPVSYGGILVPAWGGGVCQTSTNVYNAALLAGLEVVERHPHAVAPQYVAPGLDAAVAQGIADLRLRNPYPFPVRLRARAEGNRLVCVVEALVTEAEIARHVPRCELVCERSAVQAPLEVRGFRPQPGRPGMLIRLWRIKQWSGKTEREFCHETYYAPLPKGVP